MSAEVVVAAIAAAAAVIALYFNWRSARAAARAARAAEDQTEIQRQIRINAAQPFVWVDLRPDELTGTLLNLVVGNSGSTVATNVRVIADPALPRIEQLSERVGTAESKHSRPGGHVDAHCGWWGCADVAAVSGVMRVRGSLVSRDFL